MSLEFMKAVSNNNIEEVKKFLKNADIDINYLHKNESRISPVSALHVAVNKGYIEIVKLLLSEKKFNAEAMTDSGSTALHLAASMGQVEICQLLVGHINMTIKDKKGDTPYELAKAFSSAKNPIVRKKYEQIAEILKVPTFIQACCKNDLELVKKLVDDKVDVNASYDTMLGLSVACLKNYFDLAHYLISLDQVNVNALDKSQWTPLHMVLSKTPTSNVDLEQRYHLAQELIKKGADINARHPETGATPLLQAVLYDQFDAVKLLVSKGADLSFTYKKDKEDVVWTADILDFAVNHDPEIYRFLKEAKNHHEYLGFDLAKKLIASSKSFKFSPVQSYSNESLDKKTSELKI